MFLIWTRAWVFFASSVLPSSWEPPVPPEAGMTMTTMISMRVNPDRSRAYSCRSLPLSSGFSYRTICEMSSRGSGPTRR